MNDLKKIWLNNIPIQLLILLSVSVWVIISQQGEINRDGVLYLTEAQAILNLDWQQTMSLSRWPFFAILVATVHQFTGITLLHAAHVVNLLMFLLACLFFLKTIRLLTNNNTPVIYGTVILLTAIPLMDDYLGMVLRDHGLWAGFMIGVYGFVRFVKEPGWWSGVLWQTGFALGFLFRPEAVAFIVLLPVATFCFFYKDQQWLRLSQSVSLSICFGCVMLLAILFSWLDITNMNLLRMNDIVNRPMMFWDQLMKPLPVTANNVYLQHLIIEFAFSFKIIFLMFVTSHKWITGVGLLHLVLTVVTVHQARLDQTYRKTLIVLFVISLAVVLVNLFVVYVLTSRYLVMNWWLVYLIAAIGLHTLITRWTTLKPRQRLIRQASLVLLLIIYFLNILIDKPGISPEKQAAEWLQDQSLDLSEVYINDARTAFYAQTAHSNGKLNKVVSNQSFPFLLIRYNSQNDSKALAGYKAIKHFPSLEKPKLIFYIKTMYD
jgi:hypothetical protein